MPTYSANEIRTFFLKKREVCYFKQGKGTGEGRYQNRSLIVLPVLPFYSSCVQSTLIFSLNFHLIGEWHDKRELVQLNGLIETESTTAAAGALKRTHLQQNKKGRDNSHFGSGKKNLL